MLHMSAGRGEEEGERERKIGEQFLVVSPLMAPCCAPTGHLARPLLKLTAPGRKGWELLYRFGAGGKVELCEQLCVLSLVGGETSCMCIINHGVEIMN